MSKKKRSKKTSYSPYAITEEDFLNFCKWAALATFTILTIAAIITLNAKVVFYAVTFGLLIGWAIYSRWFEY